MTGSPLRVATVVVGAVGNEAAVCYVVVLGPSYPWSGHVSEWYVCPSGEIGFWLRIRRDWSC